MNRERKAKNGFIGYTSNNLTSKRQNAERGVPVYIYIKNTPPPYELMSREGGRQVRKEGREKN
jgi:hypothetical protein